METRNILARIIDTKRDEVAQGRARTSLADMKARAADTADPRNFFAAVTRPRQTLRVIAEVKKASPSAGLIRDDFDPVAIARAYEAHGAAAISCLTDETYFQGRLEYLTIIKQAVALPVLRKDFIIDPWQVYEARAAGADAILLIAECLTEPDMIDLTIQATELKLTTLIEVHDLESLQQVRGHIGFPHPSYVLLGINNRDLRTMTTDLQHTLDLLPLVPDRDVLVSESGIRTRADVQRLAEQGVHRILVGEHLMRQPDVGAALQALLTD